MSNVFIAVPHYNQLTPQSLEGLILASARHKYSINTEGGSLLALMFNKLWCRALNARSQGAVVRGQEPGVRGQESGVRGQESEPGSLTPDSRPLTPDSRPPTPGGVTHFAMHHSDIAAPAGWVDALLEEKERVAADVLSVVVPIKDLRGLTSTGWQDPQSKRITRLTMSEVMALPETFSAADLPVPSQHLMVNTGLWVCDLRAPWVEEVCFHILDGIGKGDDGLFYPRCVPEDWNFSAWCAGQGLKVFATRKVPVIHYGTAGYANSKAWGDYDHDRGDP